MRCPSVERLHFFLADDSSGPEIDQIQAHVQRCARCQEQLERLTSPANQSAVRSAPAQTQGHAAPEQPEEAVLRRLQQAYALLHPLAADTDGKAETCRSGRNADQPTAEDMLPHVAGYEILEEIGRGATGVVYKARQLSLQRLVALKMLRDGPTAGGEQLVRFRREAAAIARLRHPNIVQIYEVGEQHGRPYFSMELVAGGSLAQFLAGTPLEAGAAARLLHSLAQAVHAAHQEGIVHRDLKPANILLESVDRRPQSVAPHANYGLRTQVHGLVPKISDFGLAKQLALPDNGTTNPGAITGSEAVLGTPSYMAPEQAGGTGSAIGAGTDVYALGAILYELLTGRPPFRAATSLETVLQVLHTEPIPPRQAQPAVPRDLETICLTCLHKEPRRRYADAQALAEDLRRFLAGEPIKARPVGWWERTRKWARRRPAAAALVGVSALAVLILLGGSIWLARALQREQRERDRADVVVQQALDTMSRLVRAGYDEDATERPKPETVQQELGKEVSNFYERLLAETGPQGEAANRRVATIYYDMAVIRRNQGQPQQALQHFQEACRLQEQLVAAAPENDADRTDLINSYVNQGALLTEVGQFGEAEALLGKACTLGEQLVRRNPRYRGQLAQCYHILGNSLYFRGAPIEQQRDAYEKAAAIAEHLLEEAPTEKAYRYQCAEHHINLILVYSKQGQLDRATASAEKATRLLEALLRDEPGDYRAVWRLGECHMCRGFMAITTGQKEVALDSYAQAAQRLEEAYHGHPDRRDIRTKLGEAHGGQADALALLGRYAEALTHWQRFFELVEPPIRAEHRLRYATVLLETGDHARAATEAQTIAEMDKSSPAMLYNAACLYALCSRVVRSDSQLSSAHRETLAEDYALRAMALLHQADAVGMFPSAAARKHFEEDPDLVPLHAREDFQRFRKALAERQF